LVFRLSGDEGGEMAGAVGAETKSVLESEQTWVGVAANASSGIGQGRAPVERLVAELGRLGFPTEVAWTPLERTAMVARANADRRARCLVAAGGDGTVAALINDQPQVPITVLPAGTENLFSRHFHLTPKPRRIAAMIAAGHLQSLDLGIVSGQRFALMAGVGFDADVVTRHHLARVSRSGRMRPTSRAAYVEPVLRSSFEYRFPQLTIQVDDTGETLTGTSAFLFNLPRYALGLPFAPSAKGDDGLLDLVVFHHPGPWRALHYLWLVLRGLHLARPDVDHRRVKSVTITAPEPVPVQLDGDPSCAIGNGRETWRAEVLPAAIRVVVPRR
jgi:diacylglycerol kinase family enzyme